MRESSKEGGERERVQTTTGVSRAFEDDIRPKLFFFPTGQQSWKEDAEKKGLPWVFLRSGLSGSVQPPYQKALTPKSIRGGTMASLEGHKGHPRAPCLWRNCRGSRRMLFPALFTWRTESLLARGGPPGASACLLHTWEGNM